MNIEFYQKSDGTEPAVEFMRDLDTKMRAKLTRAIDLLEIHGTQLRAPESKHLEDGIFELRATFGGNITRLLYFFYIGNTAVLTHGFIKKTQKTPKREIMRAKEYRDDYLARRKKQNDNLV